MCYWQDATLNKCSIICKCELVGFAYVLIFNTDFYFPFFFFDEILLLALYQRYLTMSPLKGVLCCTLAFPL